MPDFDDLLAANREYAEDFGLSGFDGIAHAGIAMVTCMDSRIDPLRMIGLDPGDAKILRNPGGRVTDAALVALVLGVTPSRCAGSSSSSTPGAPWHRRPRMSSRHASAPPPAPTRRG